MLSTILLSIALISLAVIGLGFNIFFRKDGKFPETEVGHNKKMQEYGIKCSRQVAFEDHATYYNSKDTDSPSLGCGGCSSTCTK